MEKFVKNLNLDGKELLSGDLLEDRFVGILTDKDCYFLLSGKKELLLESKLNCPEIRFLTSDLFLIVDQIRDEVHNAWIVAENGEVKASFCVGDKINDILVTESHIVVTFFDEGVYGNEGPNQQGVAMFDKKGNYEGGYYDWFGDNGLIIDDCYAACVLGQDKIIFCPYCEFELATLDLKNKTQSICEVPNILHGSSAISQFKDEVFFHSPYYDQNSVFSWIPGTNKTPKNIGKITWPARGLDGGRFFAITKDSYTVWHMPRQN